MRVLLTGATGFIGSAFLRLARSKGYQVAGLVRPGRLLPKFNSTEGTAPVWLHGTLDDAPWQEIRAFAPEVCIHTAWITTPGVYLHSPENERFRDASLRFLRRAGESGVKHVVGLGTFIEYQMTPEPLSEYRTPVEPTTLYAQCKNELRLALEAEAQRIGFGFCWTRVFYPYGPGEHPSRLCSSLIQKLVCDEKVLLRTPQSAKDYIYIEDLAAALLTVVEKQCAGAINLGTGTGLTVQEIAEVLSRLLGRPELVQTASPPEVDPFPFVVADAAKLHALGWKPRWSLQRGLEELIRFTTSPTRRCGPAGEGNT